MTDISDFENFTRYLQHVKPLYKDYYIYEVDLGEPTDYNVIMHASRFENGEMVGDPYQFIVSKEYFVEDFAKFINARG